MTPDDVLDAFKDSEALLEGHFELRSGLHSDRYFQCANVLRFPRLASRLCAALVDTMKTALPGVASVDAVIAPALGGIVVGHEVGRALDTVSIFAEKEEGNLVLRRFGIVEGQRLVVAEDVITRGGRVQETIDIVEAAGGEVVAIGVLVDRSGGKARFNHPLFSLLEIEPVTYDPSQCPLCADGVPLKHPGS